MTMYTAVYSYQQALLTKDQTKRNNKCSFLCSICIVLPTIDNGHLKHQFFLFMAFHQAFFEPGHVQRTAVTFPSSFSLKKARVHL